MRLIAGRFAPGRGVALDNIILAPTHHHAARCHLFMRLAYTSGLAAFMHYHLPDRTPHSMSVISFNVFYQPVE